MGRKHITPGEIYAHKIVFIDCYICWGHQVLKEKIQLSPTCFLAGPFLDLLHGAVEGGVDS